jgi:hypothetical protein
MSETKHTPGPWRYEPGTKTIRAVPSNYWLATMDSWDGAVDNNANARLIAAAPDLLAALQALADKCVPGCTPYAKELPAARAAIRKAEGGE